jgi:hypothetical protein
MDSFIAIVYGLYSNGAVQVLAQVRSEAEREE